MFTITEQQNLVNIKKKYIFFKLLYFFLILIIHKLGVMIGFIKDLFKKKSEEKYEDILWEFFYYNRLGERVNCVILENMEYERKYLVYNQYKCKAVIKYEGLFSINDFGDDHIFI